MTTTKPWYLSRTIWASFVTVLIGAGGLAGLPVEGIDGSSLTDTLLQGVTAFCRLLSFSAGCGQRKGSARGVLSGRQEGQGRPVQAGGHNGREFMFIPHSAAMR